MSERTADRGLGEKDGTEKGRTEKEQQVLRRDAPRWLWFGVLGGPVAWAIHEVAGWLFVELTCTEGSPGFLGLSLRTISVLTTVIPLVVAGLSWLVAWRAIASLRSAMDLQDAGTRPRRFQRALFMAQLGAWMAALSILIILYDGVAVLTLAPCAR